MSFLLKSICAWILILSWQQKLFTVKAVNLKYKKKHFHALHFGQPMLT